MFKVKIFMDLKKYSLLHIPNIIKRLHKKAYKLKKWKLKLKTE